FLDRHAAHRFAQQVAVPPDAEVHRARRRRVDQGAGDAALAAARGPAFRAGIAGVDVEAHAAADVGVGAAGTPDQGPGRRVVQAGAAGAVGGGRLVDHVDLQAGAVRVELAEMEGVAMTQVGRVEQLAVAVDGGGAVHDVVAAVAVGVAGGEPV